MRIEGYLSQCRSIDIVGGGREGREYGMIYGSNNSDRGVLVRNEEYPLQLSSARIGQCRVRNAILSDQSMPSSTNGD